MADRTAETAPRELRVLVVDDNPDAAAMLAMVVRLEGYEARTATDGPTALGAARENRPDVVVCDIGMPGMDGYAVARALRATPGLERVTLIAMTGYGQDEDQARAKAAGFDHHFVKPIDPTQIEDLLRDLAARPRP